MNDSSHRLIIEPTVRPARKLRPGAVAGDWRQFVPETAALMLILLLVDAAFFGGGRFAEIAPHPFWAVVLLLSSQHGVVAGVLAATAATAALYVGALPERADGMDFYSYAARLSELPTLWFAAAILLGALRTREMNRRQRLEAELAERDRCAHEIADGFERALKEVSRLERRIASDTATLDAVLDGLARMNFRSARECVAGFGGLVGAIAGAAAFTLYLRTENGLEAIYGEDDFGAPRLADPLADKQAALDALQSGRAISRADPQGQELLRSEALLLAPIIARDRATVHGAIVISRLRRPGPSLKLASKRAAALGHVLGALLAGMRRSTSERHSSAARGHGVHELA